MALFRWTGRQVSPATAVKSAPASQPSSDLVLVSKVLPRFLAALSHEAAPVLIDLGPVVGSNIAFFGDKLACKIHVEDLYADVEKHAKRGAAGPAGAWAGRLGD